MSWWPVAISGIVDLDLHEDFPQRSDLLSKCSAGTELQYPKIHDFLQTYHQFVDDDEGLKEAKLEELMTQLKKDMTCFKDNSEEMIVIEILRILAKQSLPDKYERVKSSESSSLYVWFSIWRLLFSSSAVDVQMINLQYGKLLGLVQQQGRLGPQAAGLISAWLPATEKDRNSSRESNL
ncbi:hypothetical protein BGZ83_007773 [Gryganskiella cystojenkinii]|nr:hypothetical protein BGZ83_007773 [Gryganskiella cystojenkinii]